MKRIALITGASSGIGWEFSRLLARRDYRVVMTSRDEPRLQSAAQALRDETRAEITTIAQDLSQPDAATRLRDELRARDLVPHTLINNAGLGHFGRFAETNADDVCAMLDVNVLALTNLTHAFLPLMLERKQGAICHVASLASFFPGPMMAVYYASKAYVLSFSLALSNECAGTGVTISCLCPGPVHTRFQERAGLSKSKLAQSAMMSARRVAWEGLRGLERGQAVVLPGRKNQIFALGARYLPPQLVTAMIRRVQDGKEEGETRRHGEGES